MSAFRIEGRTAIVTGAASGIGAALAEALAARGCHLALADINEAGLETLRARIARNDARCTTTKLDVSQPEEIAAFAAVVTRDHGGAQLLFNNAGIAMVGDFEQMSAADFDHLMAINFGGAVHMTRAFLPMLRQADAAHIVNMSSLFGLIAPAGQTAYSASKFALRGFSDALRHELRDTNVGVTTVHPGGIATNIANSARRASGVSEQTHERNVRKAGRMLKMPPEKAAAIILGAVEQRKPRVLVGADAHLAAFVERISPARYWTLLSGKSAPKRDDT